MSEQVQQDPVVEEQIAASSEREVQLDGHPQEVIATEQSDTLLPAHEKLIVGEEQLETHAELSLAAEGADSSPVSTQGESQARTSEEGAKQINEKAVAIHADTQTTEALVEENQAALAEASMTEDTTVPPAPGEAAIPETSAESAVVSAENLIDEASMVLAEALTEEAPVTPVEAPTAEAPVAPAGVPMAKDTTAPAVPTEIPVAEAPEDTPAEALAETVMEETSATTVEATTVEALVAPAEVPITENQEKPLQATDGEGFQESPASAQEEHSSLDDLAPQLLEALATEAEPTSDKQVVLVEEQPAPQNEEMASEGAVEEAASLESHITIATSEPTSIADAPAPVEEVSVA